MSFVSAPLMLAAARARRRPGRWLLPGFGIAVAAAFAGGVAAQSVIVADQSARSVLSALSPLDRTVRVSWQGPLTPSGRADAQALLRRLGLTPQAQVVLMNPVRLSGTVVRPAAISPLDRWVSRYSSRPPGRCGQQECPVLLVGSAVHTRTLAAAGVRLRIVGAARLTSAVPLGFAPSASPVSPPALVTDDVAGLDRLVGLGGVFRTHSALASLPLDRLHGWQLTDLERRMQRMQAALGSGEGQFTLTAPFDGLDQARAQARAAPKRLLLAGGGTIAALALFVVLAAGGLRRDQGADVERLRRAGARLGQRTLFVAAECGWLCAVSLLAGAALAVVAAAGLASSAGEPAGAILRHSLITPAGGLALAGGWIAACALSTATLMISSRRTVDVLAVAPLAALVALVADSGEGGGALPVLLAPLCCLAAGIVTFRAASWLLRGGERLARRGPVTPRLALVSLARSPEAPSLAIAFIAVSIGLGGFALAYRATLLRGTADQGADRVPLDATVAPGSDFVSPVQVARLARWGQLASGGTVLPVRRTDASYASGGGTVTVPALA
jgi:hypothetical protein